MKNRKMMKVILATTLVFILIGSILTGCAPADKDVTSKDSATATPTTIEKPEIKIAWYASAPHPFFEGVKKGVEGFEKDSGIKVEKQIGPDWNQSSETANIEALAAKGFTSFAVYPSDPNAANGLYEELVKKGCNVINYGGSTAEPTSASFYVGTDTKAAAMQATEQLIKLMGEKGNIINVLEILEDANTVLRKQGIEEVVKKYPNVKIIQEISGMKSVEEAVQKIDDSISANLDKVDGIIATGNTTSTGVANVMRNYKAKGGKRVIHSIGIDTEPVLVQAIKDGIVDGTIMQNSYGMGYISCLLLKYQQEGWKSKDGKYTRIDSGSVYLDKTNVGNAEQLQAQMTNDLKAILESKYLTK